MLSVKYVKPICMVLNKSPYKGTRDFFPSQMREREYLFKIIKETVELFGYEPYDGPLLEEVDLYQAKSGQELIDEQIYSFTDRGGRSMAIRPEMTPTLARMIAQIHRETPKPIRWYSIPNLYRYERPQRGRLREHWQFNCDIFDLPSPYGEIEILQMAVSLMEKLGARKDHFEVLVNDRTIIDDLFAKMNVRPPQKKKLLKILDKFKKIDSSTTDKMILDVGLDQKQKSVFFDYLNNRDCPSSLSSFMDNMQIKPYLKYDPTIVRGMDYYTGIVFEIYDKHPDNRRAIAGGGTYTDLLKIFNEPPLCGTGLGMGDVTLLHFLKDHNLLSDCSQPDCHVFLSIQTEEGRKSMASLAVHLRENNIKAIFHPIPLKLNKVFSMAGKKGAEFVFLMGENELKDKSVQIKNLMTREQKTFKLDEMEKIKYHLQKQ